MHEDVGVAGRSPDVDGDFSCILDPVGFRGLVDTGGYCVPDRIRFHSISSLLLLFLS